MQLADLVVQPLEAVPVLGYRLMIKDRMRRADVAGGAAEPGQPGDRSAAGISWRGLAISTARWTMPMLSSTSTLRFRKARRHFRPAR